jgi:hypothetical protein
MILEHHDRNLASFIHPTSNSYRFYNTVPDVLTLHMRYEQSPQILRNTERRAAAHNTKHKHVETYYFYRKDVISGVRGGLGIWK